MTLRSKRVPENRQKTGTKSGFDGPSFDVGKAAQFNSGESGNPGGRPEEKASSLSAKVRKMSHPKKPISKRKRKYIQGLADGKTKKQAALDAGYSESVAISAKAHIETPDVRAAFAETIRKRIPAEKIAKRIDEGLDAKETKFFQHEGEVKETRDVVAWSERRQYASLAAEFGGYFTPQVEMTGTIVHVLTAAEKREASETIKRLIAYDSEAENPIEGEVEEERLQ